MKKYVLDTNVLISNPQSLFFFQEENTEIIITRATLEELDHLKTKTEISREVRMVIRQLSQIVLNKTYEEISVHGIPLQPFCKTLPQSVKLRIVDYTGEQKFEINKQDERIIATTIQENAVLVTRDVNMLLIALSSNCPAEQYTGDNTLKDSDVLFKGYSVLPMDFWDESVDRITYSANGKSFQLSTEDFPHGTEFYPGTYLVLSDYKDNPEEGTLIGQVESVSSEGYVTVTLVDNKRASSRKAWNVKPRDVLQSIGMDALFDNDNDVVSLIGGAGSGKSLLAMACGLELTVEQKKFSKVIYVKADAGQGVDAHGYLPGDINEKLSQNILAAKDALSFLTKDARAAGRPNKENDNKQGAMLEYLIDNYIEFPSMYYFRGRTLGNAEPGQGAFIIIDEAQNLTVHEITSIISRAGANSKVVLLGNIKQIDNKHVNALNNGMVYAVQKFRDYPYSAHVILSTVYRSRLAGFVEDNF